MYNIDLTSEPWWQLDWDAPNVRHWANHLITRSEFGQDLLK
jgi:hypothetical protein